MLKPTNDGLISLILNFSGLTFFLTLIFATVHAASSLSCEANSTISTMSNLMNKLHLDEASRHKFVYVMTHIRPLNVKVQNTLFSIDWNIVLTVSF